MKTSMGLGLSVVLMWLTPLVEASERFERSFGEASEAVRRRFYADNFVDLMGSGLPAAP